MEQFEEYTLDSAVPLGIVGDESPEFVEAELQESEDSAEAPASTDDPVRVYLKEMGSVPLLKRGEEIDLARRMERGKQRIHKALSRSPLIWRSALADYEDVRNAKVRIEDFVEIAGPDDEAKQRERTA